MRWFPAAPFGSGDFEARCRRCRVLETRGPLVQSASEIVIFLEGHQRSHLGDVTMGLSPLAPRMSLHAEWSSRSSPTKPSFQAVCETLHNRIHEHSHQASVDERKLPGCSLSPLQNRLTPSILKHVCSSLPQKDGGFQSYEHC